MNNRLNHEQVRMEGLDWYEEAGKQPLREKGFTRELMLRIEQAAAEENSRTYKFFKPGKRTLHTGLAAALVSVFFALPFAEWQSGNDNTAATVQSQAAGSQSAFPSSSPQKYEPPVGSAGFVINGKNYYMPLPLDRDKEAAFAVDTTSGILWSPPPPMANYTKPKYFHPKEPYSLYLSSKDKPELSAATARRVYTYPLYSGGAQTYNRLWGVFGAGKYVLLLTNTVTIGTMKGTLAEVSKLDVSKAASGQTIEPQLCFQLDSDFYEYKSYLALDKQNEAILMVNINAKLNPGHNNKVRLYEMKTGNIRELVAPVVTERKGAATMVYYEVDGKKRTAEFLIKIGHPWFEDGEAFDPGL